ncbi:MAG: glycosyl hydrolase family 31 [Bacteroidaceae bacterium]|nr:glycosyl hydrolase family 31 [Bacteroidaceae bacterium]
MSELRRIVFFLIISTLLSFNIEAKVSKPVATRNSISFTTSKGQLTVTALAGDAWRIQCVPADLELPQLENLIYTQESDFEAGISIKSRIGHYLIISNSGNTRIKISKRKEQIALVDSKGKVIVEESPRSRLISTGQTGTLNSLAVSQSFVTGTDEFLFGTGQFQDGYLNIRGLTRRLTQVNTQISIPMVISNKGYGILWNNYGLTDFNPSENVIELEQGAGDGTSVTVNATGTAGNVRERRFFNDFNGELQITESADYSILLDVGQEMGRKHFLMIDSDTVINASNTWLPPTSSAIIHLEKGTHKLFVSGSRGDKPTVGIRKVTETTTFSSPVAVALDYTLFAGSADEIISSYRNLTGKVPEMPDWAFGYIHCRERYDSQQELLENARRLKTENYKTSVIVQDWQWWGKYGWNAMQFDEDKYPDPKAMTDELHSMDMKLMLSVWSKIDKNSEVGREMNASGYYIDGTDWIDFFNPDASKAYWKNFSSKLLPTGIDAWWQDATEPENDDLKGRMVAGGKIPGEFYRNAYPNKVNETVYNGLKNDQPDRDPMILTRSGFIGIQRYGAINWSGDVGNDWETLRRQIAGGLNLMTTGQPWWTYDAGGFFRPNNQYTDPDYQERMMRWIQVAVYLPFMRVHGYMSRTEPWNYSEETQKNFREQINLRNRIMPYILECAEKVSKENYTMMRPLVFDFPNDTEGLKQQTEYMFGPSLLVCPVTEPGIKTMRIYLPEYEEGWVEFNPYPEATLSRSTFPIAGGQYITVPVFDTKIPVFVKADHTIKQSE